MADSERLGRDPSVQETPMRTVRLSEAEAQVRAAQASFRRALSAWASDLLALRREGLTLTVWVKNETDPHMDSERKVA